MWNGETEMDEAQGGRRKRCQDHGPTYLEKPSSLLSGILDVTKAQFSLIILLCFFSTGARIEGDINEKITRDENGR